MSEEKLLPCPFCGSSASLGYFGGGEVTASCDGPDDNCPGRAGACAYFCDGGEDAARNISNPRAMRLQRFRPRFAPLLTLAGRMKQRRRITRSNRNE